MSGPGSASGPDDATVDLTGGERDPFDRIAEEFARRCRDGEAPSIAEYEARFPEQAEKVRDLLGAVAMMEQLRRGSRQARFVPERLGEFRVVRELGRGGMGVVYEAVQESLSRQVAVKAMHHVQLDPKRLQRFRREAEAVAQLHHTNIVPIFGVGEHDGLPYYVMQYIRGRGLEVVLDAWRRDGAPTPQGRWTLAAKVGMQAADALQHAHEHGVLHRDIKPSNLLLDDDGTVWITDFGLAKLAGRDDLTASGDVIGTLRYLAPESLRGESDPRSDVYSLGLTLYELITLNAPHGVLSPSELLKRVSEASPPSPKRLVPSLPADLETIVQKAIAHDPKDRYPTASALVEDLRRFLEDRPIRARRATWVERGWRWSRRNRALAALTATAAASLALAAVAGWVGFVSESQAKREAQANARRVEARAEIDREFIERIFDRFVPKDEVATPPLGMLALSKGPLGNAGRDGRGPNRKGPGGPPARPKTARPKGDDGPPREPGGQGSGFGGRPPGGHPDDPSDSKENAALLNEILGYYERFALENSTDVRLRGEAARAYLRVAMLYEHLGSPDEAERAGERAVEMLDGLVARSPDDRTLRLRLFQACVVGNPWRVAASSLDRVEGRLRKARSLIERLHDETPDDADVGIDRVKVLARLGTVCLRLGRLDEAEASYREGIELARSVGERSPGDHRAPLDRTLIQEMLASVLAAQGKLDEARDLAESVRDEIRGLEEAGWHGPPVQERVEKLVEVYEALGDPDRAREMQEWSQALSRRRGPDEFRRMVGDRDPGPGESEPPDGPPAPR